MPQEQNPGSVSRGVRKLAFDLFELIYTRLSLLGVELQEEKLRLLRLAVFFAVATLCAGFALLFFSLFIIVLAGENHRLLAIGGLTVLFAAGATLAGIKTLLLAREGGQLFQASLAEIKKDQASLHQGPKL